ARLDTQRAVTVMTIVTSLVGLGGIYLGGRLDVLGLTTVLVIQALVFGSGVFAIRQLPGMPVIRPVDSLRMRLTQGMRAVWDAPLVRDIIGLNLLSSLFNAGAYVIAI